MKVASTRLPAYFWLLVSVFAAYVLVGGYFLRNYLLWDSQWLLALLLAPLVAQVQPGRRFSPALAASAVVFALLAAYLHNSTFYFMAIVVALMCAAQLLFGAISPYPLLLLLAASPVFKYIANTLSFPLRLQLTEWAVGILSGLQVQAQAAGNLILVNGQEFAVDPACAGLSMLSLALILAVFILFHLQRTQQKKWPVWMIGALLVLMLLLNLFANLLRILLLVWFSILPGNLMHDVIGLLCLGFYALLPFYLIAQKVQPMALPFPKTKRNRISLRGSLLINYMLLLILCFSGYLAQQKKTLPTIYAATQLSGFAQQPLPNGVTKYSSTDALVYVKPIKAFYSTEHHPLVCWQGSGYTFKRVQLHQLGDHTVYIGELQKGASILYTAWWMENGAHRTTDQWDWRWRMARGEANFKLINVTVAQKDQLKPTVMAITQNLMRNHRVSLAR